jgi:hypothetical protein
MDRLALFRSALAKSRDHVVRWGEHLAIQSIIAQLEYLEAVEADPTSDRSRLTSINLGVLAAREIEGRDMPLAELLYEVSGEVEKMPLRV